MKTLAFLVLSVAVGFFGVRYALAQTKLTSAEVLVCPVPLWPPAACPKTPIFSALTNSANAAGSVSKSAPVWAHTFAGYAPADLVVACPAGATVSSDLTQCTTAAGADASVLLAASAVALAGTGAPVTAPATSVFVPLNWSCSTAHNVATCTAPVPQQ